MQHPHSSLWCHVLKVAANMSTITFSLLQLPGGTNFLLNSVSSSIQTSIQRLFSYYFIWEKEGGKDKLILKMYV